MALKTPKEVAKAAVDILCTYDSGEPTTDIDEMRERTAKFFYHFVIEISKRQAQALLKEPLD